MKPSSNQEVGVEYPCLIEAYGDLHGFLTNCWPGSLALRRDGGTRS